MIQRPPQTAQPSFAQPGLDAGLLSVRTQVLAALSGGPGLVVVLGESRADRHTLLHALAGELRANNVQISLLNDTRPHTVHAATGLVMIEDADRLETLTLLSLAASPGRLYVLAAEPGFAGRLGGLPGRWVMVRMPDRTQDAPRSGQAAVQAAWTGPLPVQGRWRSRLQSAAALGVGCVLCAALIAYAFVDDPSIGITSRPGPPPLSFAELPQTRPGPLPAVLPPPPPPGPPPGPASPRSAQPVPTAVTVTATPPAASPLQPPVVPDGPTLPGPRPVSASALAALPAGAPLRLVFSYPGGDGPAEQQGRTLAAALQDSGMGAATIVASAHPAARLTVGYYFAEDRGGAERVQRLLAAATGQPVRVVAAAFGDPRSAPMPGTVEIQVPHHAARPAAGDTRADAPAGSNNQGDSAP